MSAIVFRSPHKRTLTRAHLSMWLGDYVFTCSHVCLFARCLFLVFRFSVPLCSFFCVWTNNRTHSKQNTNYRKRNTNPKERETEIWKRMNPKFVWPCRTLCVYRCSLVEQVLNAWNRTSRINSIVAAIWYDCVRDSRRHICICVSVETRGLTHAHMETVCKLIICTNVCFSDWIDPKSTIYSICTQTHTYSRISWIHANIPMISVRNQVCHVYRRLLFPLFFH